MRNNSKFSISYNEYLEIERNAKIQKRRNILENCYMKMFEVLYKMHVEELREENFMTEEEVAERDVYLVKNEIPMTPNFNILYDIVKDKNPGDVEIIRTDKYGLFQYTDETHGTIAIQLPMTNCLVKIERKNSKIAFLYCYKNMKNYIIARECLCLNK